MDERGCILIILHQEHSTPGRIGRLLSARGYRLDIRRPRFGDPLPPSMENHAGAVIFGGPMSVNDPDPFIRTEVDWIDVPLRENAPLLGICLGAQMMAIKLGEPVSSHPAERVEIGYYPIWPTEAADRLAGVSFPRWVYHWHREGFGVPPGATSLARGEDFECQAFMYGRSAIGLQFHPEVTYAMLCRWGVHGACRLEAPNAMPAHQHRDAWFVHDAAVARWTDAFLGTWTGDEAKPDVTPSPV